MKSSQKPGLFLSAILITTILFLVTDFAKAQISIAPTAVFMSDQNPFANVIVSNGSETSQEISISFRFGYTVSDDGGNISMRYDTTGHESSFVEHINAFPRNFVLEPGQRQTVRLAARGYGAKQDGTYWSRVNILASPLSPPVEAAAGQDAVTARININFEQVIPAFFKKGSTTTGIEIHDITFHQEEENESYFLVRAAKNGNSPYIGNSHYVIRDAENQVVLENDINFTVYTNITRKIPLNLSDLSPGNYTAEFSFRTDRRDVSRDNLIQADPVAITKEFMIE